MRVDPIADQGWMAKLNAASFYSRKTSGPRRSLLWLTIGLAGLMGGGSRVMGSGQTRVVCKDCHALEGQEFDRSVHANTFVQCLDCHGGDSDYYVASEKAVAWTTTASAPASPTGRPAFDHGPIFTGKPDRRQVPQTCGHCHADVERMNPYGLRTDQLDRYKTSIHGKVLFEKNDDQVAVCIDCHGVHAVLDAGDPASSVHPLNVPDTCGRCHADASLMVRYQVSSAVVDQYKTSVHGRGLLKDHDVAMPNCATCHDNHGAQPPGFRDVGHVCGRCHQQTENYFKESLHAKFSNFPPCIGCHAPDADHRHHGILSVTRSPDDLVKSYRARRQELVNRGLPESQIATILEKAVREPADKIPVRLTTVCRRCHGEEFQTGHRIFLEDLDKKVMTFGPTLDTLLRDAQWQYVQAGERVDRVGRGIILVQNEAFALSQARTQLIALSAMQHTLDDKRIAQSVQAVTDVCRQVNDALDEKERGLLWRYYALLPLWGFLGIFIVAMRQKYHQLKDAYVVPYKSAQETGS